MTLLVDAYNVLKSLFGAQLITEHIRYEFIQRMSNYARLQQVEVVLFFDGGPELFAYSFRYKNSIVWYSGSNKTADELIQEYIQKHQKQNLLMVSTDRELQCYATHFRVACLDSLVFLNFVVEAEKKLTREQKKMTSVSEQCIKTTESCNDELAAIMEQCTQIIPIKNEEIESKKNRIKTGNKLAKKERQLWHKLKKL